MKSATFLKHYTDKYSALVGKTVKGVAVDDASSDICFGLIFTDGTIAWIMKDDEGNGPGGLDIIAPSRHFAVE